MVPKEHDEYEAFSSTQAPTKGQVVMHGVLGVAMHKIVVRTKRLGGGFGGKETRAAFINVRSPRPPARCPPPPSHPGGSPAVALSLSICAGVHPCESRCTAFADVTQAMRWF